MQYILSKYGTDPEITCLINNRELYFVPCVNPDGYVYNKPPILMVVVFGVRTERITAMVHLV
jgi:murein tripeptide amidase MpaA